jgi:hypothetical protein
MSVTHGPCEVRKVTRVPLLTAVPDQVHAFARLFAALEGVTVHVNIPSSLIRRMQSPSSVYRDAPTQPKVPYQAPLSSLMGAEATGPDVEGPVTGPAQPKTSAINADTGDVAAVQRIERGLDRHGEAVLVVVGDGALARASTTPD